MNYIICVPETGCAAGALIAPFHEVRHCFERRMPGGRAVLSVIEGEGRGDIDRAIERIRIAGALDAPRIAYTVREYARSGMRYFTEGDQARLTVCEVRSSGTVLHTVAAAGYSSGSDGSTTIESTLYQNATEAFM